jgi:hypothetical protein
MSHEQLEILCALARLRVQAHINRVAAQQLRRMREAWSKP